MTVEPLFRKANFYETDQMGIIHHSNYIRWFEEARIDFMEQKGFGYEKCVSAGVDFALLSLSCEYKSMVRFGDAVLIKARVTEIKSSRMTVEYEITDARSARLCTVGKTSHCFLDSVKQRPVSLKKALPEVYEMFLQSVRELK